MKQKNNNPRILMFGAGVIGSIYGGLLAKSGADVTFLARGKRWKEISENGLLLKETGKETEKINVKLISELKPEDEYDYVFVALRSEQVSSALPVLSENISGSFVFMVNTCKGYSEWMKSLGEKRVIPAFPGAGGKIENGITHYKLTDSFVQKTTFGEINGKITERIRELNRIFKAAGFVTEIEKKMDVWQKSHVAMVCPLALGIYYDGGTNYTLSENRKALQQTAKALKEAFDFLKKSEIGIRPPKNNIFRIMPTMLVATVLSQLFNSKWAETMISNHALNAKEEMVILTNEFIELAQNKGFELKELKKLMN